MGYLELSCGLLETDHDVSFGVVSQPKISYASAVDKNSAKIDMSALSVNLLEL